MTYAAQKRQENHERDNSVATEAVLPPTVFIVDDYDLLREALSWLMEANGFAVELFRGGEEFLARYDPQRPGCLLLDVQMPGMGGLDVLEDLRRRGSTLPVILMSGSCLPDTLARASRAGIVDFLEKPFSDQMLLRRIRQAIGLDRRERRAPEANGQSPRRAHKR